MMYILEANPGNKAMGRWGPVSRGQYWGAGDPQRPSGAFARSSPVPVLVTGN